MEPQLDASPFIDDFKKQIVVCSILVDRLTKTIHMTCQQIKLCFKVLVWYIQVP